MSKRGLMLDPENKNRPKSDRRMFIFLTVGSALLMSLGVSSVMTAVNAGLSAPLEIWLRGWLIGFAVALPLSMIIPRFLRWTAPRIGVAERNDRGDEE